MIVGNALQGGEEEDEEEESLKYTRVGEKR